MAWIVAVLFLALLTLVLRVLPGKSISVPAIAVCFGIAAALFELITRNFAASSFLVIVGGLFVAFVPPSKAL